MLLLQFFQDEKNGSQRLWGSVIGVATFFTSSSVWRSCQCSIPVFEKLLPEPHNTLVMMLLFSLSHWHGLAKLCMHTDETLRLMESITVMLGNHLRTFTNETCSTFSTKELCREAKARTRRQGHETLRKLGNPSSRQSDAQVPIRKMKTLNLQTYKLHALGDYPEQIWAYGTMDSYSTQSVSHPGLLVHSSLLFSLQGELEHRVGKNWFAHTSRKVFIPQLVLIEQCQTCTHHIQSKLAGLQVEPKEILPENPEDHHHIGHAQNFPEDLFMFTRKNSDDPLTKVCRIWVVLSA